MVTKMLENITEKWPYSVGVVRYYAINVYVHVHFVFNPVLPGYIYVYMYIHEFSFSVCWQYHGEYKPSLT